MGLDKCRIDSKKMFNITIPTAKDIKKSEVISDVQDPKTMKILFYNIAFFTLEPINVIASFSAFKNGIRKTYPFFCNVLIIKKST